MTQTLISSFGDTVRRLREAQDMPLRKLAALLDLDQSTLSKIERGERSANLEMITRIAKIFSTDKRALIVGYFSDKIVEELGTQEYAAEVLKTAARKITRRQAEIEQITGGPANKPTSFLERHAFNKPGKPGH